MTEVGETIATKDAVKPVSFSELEYMGEENLANLRLLCKTVASLAQTCGIEAHLLLVGGYVNHKKKDLPRKDIDLILRSPALATAYRTGENFDRFAGFVNEIGGELDWNTETDSPFFDSHEHSSDGKVILRPQLGLPIEVLPVRKDTMGKSFEEYLSHEREPHKVLL